MAGAAYANGYSQIRCTDGEKGSPCHFDQNGSPDKWHWDAPTTQVTSPAINPTVFVNNKPLALEGDTMPPHPDGDPCVSDPVLHSPALVPTVSTVKVNGSAVGRVGDKFNSDGHMDHEIASGSSDVNIG